MANTEKQMKSIWYFVGLMLVTIGGIIFLAGLYYLVFPVQSTTVLAELYPNIWWGAIMLIFGIIFLVFQKNPKE